MGIKYREKLSKKHKIALELNACYIKKKKKKRSHQWLSKSFQKSTKKLNICNQKRLLCGHNNLELQFLKYNQFFLESK